ncbi:MAG: class I SAM-dependent methyltransferase [Rhodospirillales bacterium]
MVPAILRRSPQFLAPIAVLYGRQLARFGARPPGVLWRNGDGQRLRFEILLRVLDDGEKAGGVTINDLGCGYAALFDFVAPLPVMRGGRYFGYDICEDMVDTARRRIDDARVSVVHSLIATREADYSFASGTYNLKADVDEAEWTDYVKASLAQLWSRTTRGLAFNMPGPDHGKREDGLYYADPQAFLDFCRDALSPDTTLIDDYPLAEWTILVRR